MADDIIEQTQEQMQEAANQELSKMMAINLNGGIVPQEQSVAGEGGAAGAAQQQAPNEPPAFTFDQFKEKYNYEKPEDIFKEIEEARVLKANPPQAAPIKYENEVSEKLAKAFASGKVDEVYQFLDEQRRLDKYLTSDVTEDTAGEIIKLGLRLAHKDLTEAEIDYKFNKQYGLPKEPQGDAEDEDFIEKHKAWEEQVADIKMSKVIDAKLARPQLEIAKTKLVLPEIITPENAEYLQWQKLMEDQAKLDAEIAAEYKSIEPKYIETKLNFNDEPNKIAFEFQYEPDADTLKQSVDLASNIESLLASYISNGKFDKQAFLRDVHFGKNKETILMSAMNQAKNATIKSFLPDNNTGGSQRQFPQQQNEVSELAKGMKMAGIT